MSAYSKITGNNGIVTGNTDGTIGFTDKLMEKILQSSNLNEAYKKVKTKGQAVLMG